MPAIAGEEWKVQRDYRRRLNGGGNEETVVFRFCDGGHSTADLVVADSTGKPLPAHLLWGKRGGDTVVAFNASKAQGEVAVYYGGGSSGGASPAGDWRPKLSLLLYTLPIPGGALESHKPIAAGLKRDNVYGVGFVDKIWHGQNPFGPETDFASAYVGYLNIEKSGTYKIFTASTDASFVLLDGKPLVEWPGRHDANAGTSGQHGANVHLTKGQHKIEYYHAVLDAQPIMVLGWTPPGEKGFKIVPEGAFWHTPRATAGPLERRGDAPVAALEWHQEDQLLHDKPRPGPAPKPGHPPEPSKDAPRRDPAFYFTRFSLSSQCRSVPPKGKVVWDYGDGTKAECPASDASRGSEHIYVGKGPFTASVRVAGEDGKPLDQYRAAVQIEPMPKNWTILDAKAVKDYVRAIVALDYSNAPAATMDALWELVETQEDIGLIQPFLETYVHRFGAKGSAWPAADRLALALSVKEPQRAFRLYTTLAANAPTTLDAARAQMERIEIMLHKLKDPDKALAIAQNVKAYGSTAEARVAAVKIGDVYRAQGDFEKAEEAYRAVQQITYAHMDKRSIPVRQGGYLETVASHIKNNQLRAAREALVLWAMEAPIGNLSGDLPLMTAKYFDKLGEPDRALAELETIVKINPLSPYLPEIELMMARAYKAKGERTRAMDLYNKVLREYPRSRAAQQAQREGL